MSKRLLLDTDVLIEYLKDRHEVSDYLGSLTADLHVSVISVAELFAGVRGDREKKSLEQLLLAFTISSVTEKTGSLGEDISVENLLTGRESGES